MKKYENEFKLRHLIMAISVFSSLFFACVIASLLFDPNSHQSEEITKMAQSIAFKICALIGIISTIISFWIHINAISKLANLDKLYIMEQEYKEAKLKYEQATEKFVEMQKVNQL